MLSPDRVIAPYRAPRWLPDGHSQTIWPAVIAPLPRVSFHRVRWDTPDGDFVDLDFLEPPSSADALDPQPLVVLFHGLEGGSSSHYARGLMNTVGALGWRGVVPHFRGCGGEPNRLARAYHSGDSEEVDWMLRRLRTGHAAAAPVLAVGVSLGGNALMKWLGERGDAARDVVRAAVAVCAPQDLEAGARSLSSGFNRVYMANFLKTLKRKSLDKLDRFPALYDRAAVLASRTFFDFDTVVTAPLHGFRDCYDYWTRSSCKRFLGGVAVPALVINALNDPFVPASALARPAEVSRHVTLEYPAHGGHVGFPSERPPGGHTWLPARVLAYFRAHV